MSTKQKQIHRLVVAMGEMWRGEGIGSLGSGVYFTGASPVAGASLVARASLVAQRLKCLPAVRETRVLSLGWEDPLEKEVATHSSVLAWRIPWREEPSRLQSMGSQRVRHD